MITVFMTALSMTSQAYFMFQLQNTWLLWTTIGVTFGIEIYIFCCNGGRTFPANMILLGVFTFCEGYIVSFISSATGSKSGNGTVLLAAGLTMGNFFNNIKLSLSHALHTHVTLKKISQHHIWWLLFFQ